MQELRGWRDRIGAAPAAVLPARLEAGGYERTADHVARLARCTWSPDGGDPAATVSVPGGAVAVLPSDAVDLDAAKRRIDERRGWLDAEIARAETKLANEGFVAKARADVVARGARQARPAARGARRAVTTWSVERAERHLLGLELFGMRFGLERMRRLLTALGSPQERFGAIHVVGTNGKSSTVRMAAALLEAHGVRAGAFLSPHLTSFAERIRIGDRDLEPDAFGAAVQRAAAAAAKVDRGLEPGDRITQFELLAAAAFDELARRGVEVAVVEAGLGGRHDATGVLRAPVVVLTNVGLEHTRWLGPTIADIAREKLAVVAPGAALVLGEATPEVEALAVATGARIVRPVAVDTPLPGYQRTNFAVACAAAREQLGRLDPAVVARVAAADRRAGAAAARRRATADDPRRRAQPERRRGAGRGAARAPVRRRRLDPRRQGRGGDAAPAAGALPDARLHGGAQSRARSRPPRWRRWCSSSAATPRSCRSRARPSPARRSWRVRTAP